MVHDLSRRLWTARVTALGVDVTEAALLGCSVGTRAQRHGCRSALWSFLCHNPKLLMEVLSTLSWEVLASVYKTVDGTGAGVSRLRALRDDLARSSYPAAVAAAAPAPVPDLSPGVRTTIFDLSVAIDRFSSVMGQASQP